MNWLILVNDNVERLKNMQVFENKTTKMRKCLTTFRWIVEFGAVQKRVNIVDIVESFHASNYLQKSASIQRRTGLSKFAEILSKG